MKNFKFSKRLFLLILFVVSLFIVLFVGRKFDPETGKRNFIITQNGLEHFRKGLDVSGGTRLIYKISYEKYEQLDYSAVELASVKQTIETIITKNLDKRISKLGVSDYVVYSKKIGEEDFIIVEIGGVSDIQQAKETIGRTVELEFRILNKEEPTANIVAMRKEIAKNLLEETKKNSENMKNISQLRGSEGIFYHEFSGVTIQDLPYFYAENKDLLDSQKLNIVSEVVQSVYEINQYQDENDQTVSEEIKGFTFFILKDRQESVREIVSAQDIIFATKKFDLKYEQVFEKQDLGIEAYSYKYNGKTLVYNGGDFASGQSAYNIDIYERTKESSLGKTSQESIEIEEKADLLVNKIKSELVKTQKISDPDLAFVFSGWIDSANILSIIPDFSNFSGDKVQVYQNQDTYFFVKFYEEKKPEESMFITLQVFGVDQEKFESELKTQVTYTIQDIFVQDRETRVQAVDKDTKKVLNGAYFSYASAGLSQLGQKVVNISFDEEGKTIFCSITEQNIGNQMAIFVGGEIVTNATINAKICGGGAYIEGNFANTKRLSDGKIAVSHDEGTEYLIENLNDGTMPAPLISTQEEKINPTLGIGALKMSIIAGIVGFVAIFLMMLVMYSWKKGLITLAVLLNFIVVLLAFIKLTDFALSLSGIAALILSIGMGVDANILIFERLREELKSGKSMLGSLQTAVIRSRAPIKDGQISTGLIALVLFALGINIFKGFGSMMIINLLIILFINVPVTEYLLRLVYKKRSDYLQKSVLDEQVKDL